MDSGTILVLTLRQFVERGDEVVVGDDGQPHEHVDRRQDVDDQATLRRKEKEMLQ